MKRDSSEDSATSSTISNESESVTAVNDVISFNVGGTIIAVLRSTLLLQAPNSTFAAKYSDRWVQQPDELDECGNIYMVKENMVPLHLHCSYFMSFRLYFLSLLFFLPLFAFWPCSFPPSLFADCGHDKEILFPPSSLSFTHRFF